MKKYYLIIVFFSYTTFSQTIEYSKLSKDELVNIINSKNKELKSLKEKIENEKNVIRHQKSPLPHIMHCVQSYRLWLLHSAIFTCIFWCEFDTYYSCTDFGNVRIEVWESLLLLHAYAAAPVYTPFLLVSLNN